MDREQARQALEGVDALAAGMRAKARSRAWLAFGLGVAAAVILVVFGVLVPQPASYAITGVGIVPLMTLVIYTATRPVVPRHYRTLYALCTTTGALLYSVVVTVGSAVFPGSLAWWLPGALVTAVPFFLVGYLDLRATRRQP
ncbi:hypothetical protein [Nonomuraea sediminis]|uniref:hypothetical protein n=1 Tax=Nonomuraea sediminis TaxID=2835864 RepID=UPI001BDD8431|nr:hypothetical protein [Nonomuraea sediminis]